MTTLKTLGLLLTLVGLTSCGGGGSPYVATTAADCALPLKYANGVSSGIAIAESSDWTRLNTELARTLAACPIERLQTVSLGLCIRHDRTGELTVKVTGPENNSTSLSLAGKAGVGDSACTGLDPLARLFRLSLDIAPFSPMTTLNGPWLVQVRDSQPGFGSGTLIGWSLELQGLQW